MSEMQQFHKITPQHLTLKAVVYLRQSSPKQVDQNLESQRLQYAMAERAKTLGFTQVETIDSDLGSSASPGAPERTGFDYIMSSVARGEVDAALYDAPVTQYLSNGEFAGQVDVVPVTYSRQDYALGLRAGSPAAG